MASVRPYGSWPSPIDAATVAGDTRSFGAIDIDDGTPYWLERRPSEGGRGVVCRADESGGHTEVTPEDVDVRTTVHEYGGGDFAVADGTIVYSRFEDQRLYRDAVAGEPDPQPLTPEPPEPQAHRYADFEFGPEGDWLICVRERHDTEGEPVNELVRIGLTDQGATEVVASGHDFYAAPRIDPASDHLVWLTWDHPKMPWDGTELHLAPLEEDGSIGEPRTVMGGGAESVFQPTWGPDGSLYAVSDRTGWWNVYALGTPGEEIEAEIVLDEAAEYGTPQWAFGLGTIAPLGEDRILAIRNQGGSQDLGILEGEAGFTSLDLPYEVYPHPRIASEGDSLVTIAAGPRTPATVITVDADGSSTTHRSAFDLEVDPAYVSEPTHVSFPTGPDGEETAHGLYYPPKNPDVEAPGDAAPPLVVKVHGGPTSQTMPIVDLEVQYFTTRGIGVMDVNYRGSTGYGRAYRDRLRGEWGNVDTQDCVAAARYLTEEGLVDGDRLAIRGGSAGGYAVLCALAFEDTFDAGASYYGVGDLRALAEHTHKFESRYLDGLVGPLPEAEDLYQARSPTAHASGIDAPLLVLQGGEDRVVPRSQAESLVDALVTNDTPYAYLEFPEERHGFRAAEARETALESEFGFYASVFGFTPDGINAIDLDEGTFTRRTPTAGD